MPRKRFTNEQIAFALPRSKQVVKRGKTPALAPDEARAILDAIDVSTPIGLRDRALIGLMVYTFARLSSSSGVPAAPVL